jgi:hypothetical protein
MREQRRADVDDSKTSFSVSPPGFSDDSPSSRFSWHVSNEEKARNWFTRWFIDWWGMEILSLLFSAICMTIIVVVLLRVDGKEMPKCEFTIAC